MPFPADGTKAKLGKGTLFLDILDDSGLPTGLQDMGSCDAIELSAEIDKAELFSAKQASAPKMASTVRRSDYTLQITCREFTLNNLKLFLLGTDNEKAQTLAATQNVTHTNIVPGRFYEIGHRQVTAVTILRGSDALVSGTDYVLNAEFGIIKYLADGPANLVSGDDPVVTYSRPALTIDQVRLNTSGSRVARLLFLADDSNQDGDGKHDRLELWRVDVAPEGTLNVISEDFGSFQLTADILDDGVNHPNDPFGTLDRVRAAA